MYESPRLRVDWSEPVDGAAARASSYSIEPAIAVKGVELSADGRSSTLTLAGPPQVGHSYSLHVSGVRDVSPAANAMAPASIDFSVTGPVYALERIGPEQMGKTISGVPGLPVKGGDPWTLNLFVRMSKQPSNHTMLAGFGRCDAQTQGQGRYLCKFAGGVHFWSHNHDVDSRTPFDLNRWQMITATYDGRTVRLYKDGQKIGERPLTLDDDENAVRIAPIDPWDKRYLFDGDLAGLTIWGSASSAESIRALLATGPG